MTAGFEVRVFMCQHPRCTERADGLPDGGGRATGLPVGWVQVQAKKYDRAFEGGVTTAFKDVAIRHYCSAAHLPVDLLPDEAGADHHWPIEEEDTSGL